MKTRGSVAMPPATEQDFPIVGIGASQGGLNAFTKFLKVLPEKTGMAFVIVQHLDPDFKSILPSLLSKVTSIPVNVIKDDIHLAPDNIYVIPANQTLTTFDGVLKLTPRKNIRSNSLIDVFFTSLAEVHQSMAVGIVLTGTGTDGTSGLRAIKKFGGITFAQDLSSSVAEGMPGSAAEANVVDFILPVEEIPERLIEFFRTQHDKITEISGDMEQEVSDKIMHLLHQNFNIEFSHYKQRTIQRRIARRIAMTNEKNITDYFTLVSNNKEEIENLYKDLLIPVTSFFRDAPAYNILKSEIIPSLFSQKEHEKAIRIWCAGCSTGQEAYSLAMLFYEYAQASEDKRQIQIFATDVSHSAISYARKAVYTSDEIIMLSEARQQFFFNRKSDDHFQVIKPLRDMCVFAEHNFLKDPPFSKIDLLSCRNVLIYMEPYLQKKALSAFHYALNTKGFLLLGKSETIAHSPELFTTFNPMEKIYTSNSIEKKIFEHRNESKINKLEKQQLTKPLSTQSDFRKVAETLLLKDFTPTHVIINEQMEIVYIHGDISPFLEPPQGKATFNLLRMAREGLSFELRNLVQRSRTSNMPVTKEHIPMMIKDKLTHATIQVIPLENSLDIYNIIIFNQIEPVNSVSEIDSKDSVINDYISRITQLELELARTREDMRLVTEEQETVSEELQSANEEMLSSNEELQSLNEELESSKEELINSNEELRLLVDQLQIKNKQINAINKYTDTLMRTISESLLVLDSGFGIRTANHSFNGMFENKDDIIDQNFFEIKKRLFNIQKLKDSLKKLWHQKHSEMLSLEINLKIGNNNRVLQLNASKFISPDDENLMLLSFLDLTEQKSKEKVIKDASDELENKISERNQSILLINAQLEQYAHTANHEFREPLRKLITFSKFIKKLYKEKNSDQVFQYLEKIELAASRLSELVNDMHNFASVKHHHKLFQKTDLNQIIKDTIFDFELVIEEKKAKVVIDNKLPEIIAIPFQMNQLFYDLISNSLKFVKAGTEPVIRISSSKLSVTALKKFPKLNPKKIYYQIDIEDNGIGFNQKYATQIFTMFQRLNSAFNYPGTGIGLAICKKIVDDYHGHIYAEGVENSKAIFHVILPESQPLKN